MTLSEFIKKYNSKKVEVHGSANAMYQCTDLANLYIQDVLKLPIIKWTNAKDFPNHPIAKKHFDYIKNTPMGIPKKGDLIIWGGRWGHIAIFLSGDVNWFTSFDQNWPTGSVCHKVDHSYTNVIGWLRPKGGSMINSDDLQKCLEQYNHLMNVIKEKDKVISSQATELTKLKKENKVLDDKVEDAGDKLIQAEALKEKWHGLYKQSQTNLESCKIDRGAFQTKITKMKNKSLITADRKTLWLELVKDYLGKREVLVKNETSKKN
ncbi:MAG: CHAP domain-containing protein [Patescibacteria group bacterium]|nr:CHAP domain-containing protein [Patescibacteria group bacterium]